MQRIKGVLFLLGAFTLAGTAVIAARYVTGKLGPYTITAVSLFFAIMFLLPFVKWKSLRVISHLQKKVWFYLLFQAICGVFLYRMFLLFGLLHTSSAEAGILTGTTPAITVVLSKFLLKEKISSIKTVGVLGTLIGIFLIQNISIGTDNFSIAHFTGNFLIICAAACESLFNTCSKITAVKNQSGGSSLSPVVQTILVSLMAMILCLVPAGLENPVFLLSQADEVEWIALIWYGVFVTALAYIFWYAGIRLCALSTAAAFSGMVPFTAMFLSVLILNENATFQQWLGCIFLIASIGLIGLTEKTPSL
ncbi:DMT family transporter [Pectinatus frisingensis]|uniref:DMT family transporter n=1 Tax=Pectinatus frisingensis TaxID=865 RepID=UPI0018C68AF0|nr:EamA family transporter [Pectinatus frisingensis]